MSDPFNPLWTDFFEVTVRGKIEREFMVPHELMLGEPPFRWGTDGVIPAFLLKDCDRDEDEPDQYGRDKCQE